MNRGCQRAWKSTMNVTPACSAAATIARASATLVASGFSTSTCLPARSIASVGSTCRKSGVAIADHGDGAARVGGERQRVIAPPDPGADDTELDVLCGHVRSLRLAPHRGAVVPLSHDRRDVLKWPSGRLLRRRSPARVLAWYQETIPLRGLRGDSAPHQR